jgi:hypothetical protein
MVLDTFHAMDLNNAVIDTEQVIAIATTSVVIPRLCFAVVSCAKALLICTLFFLVLPYF